MTSNIGQLIGEHPIGHPCDSDAQCVTRQCVSMPSDVLPDCADARLYGQTRRICVGSARYAIPGDFGQSNPVTLISET